MPERRPFIDRFDLRMDGTYRGLEDFCVLNAPPRRGQITGQLRDLGEETLRSVCELHSCQCGSGETLQPDCANCALRNGDAHLKNFGIVYDDVQGEARLAPVYDPVTTFVYTAQDRMALTLQGSTQWPAAKELRRLGETRAGCPPARATQTLERIAEAIHATAPAVRRHMNEHPEFAETGQRMLREWEAGVSTSLRG